MSKNIVAQNTIASRKWEVTMTYYCDKNGKELKIGQYVLTRTNEFGKITSIEYENTNLFFMLNNDSNAGWYSTSLTVLSDEEAMLRILEQ